MNWKCLLVGHTRCSKTFVVEPSPLVGGGVVGVYGHFCLTCGKRWILDEFDKNKPSRYLTKEKFEKKYHVSVIN